MAVLHYAPLMSWIWRRLGFRKPLYHFWFLLCLLVPVSASGQAAAGTFTTVKATSPTSTAVCVGCPLGSTTPAANSGITAATMVLPSGVPSVTTNKLYSSAGALFFNGLALATGSSISGTANTVAKFTAATVLGDSIITDSGTVVAVAGALNANGNIMTGTNGAEGNVIVNGPAGSNRILIWRTAGVSRWFAYATSIAESGANAGSNWRLDAYDDVGTIIGTTILATRATLAVTLGGALTVTGTSALSGATTVATSFQLTGAAPVYLANVNNGYLFRNAANGATLFSITNAGVGTFVNGLTASSTLEVTGNFTVATNKLTVAAATGNTVVAGTLGVTGDVAVATNKFTVTAASGNTLIAGTGSVTGNFAVATNKFTVQASDGATTAAGDITAQRSGATHWIISGSGQSISSVAFDNDAASGNSIVVERNNDGVTPGAGSITLMRRDGAAGVLWVDATGVVRTNTTLPTNATDTGGTVVGTQTSTRATKTIHGLFTDNAMALRTMLATPLYDFEYRSGAYHQQRFIGITTDDSPLFGMDLGRSFNPITAFGYTVAAFKAQADELDVLRARVLALEKR